MTALVHRAVKRCQNPAEMMPQRIPHPYIRTLPALVKRETKWSVVPLGDLQALVIITKFEGRRGFLFFFVILFVFDKYMFIVYLVRGIAFFSFVQ